MASDLLPPTMWTLVIEAARPLATSDGLDTEVRYLFGLIAGQATTDGK